MILDAFKLTDKVALVTGCDTGLGQGMAIGLAEAGCDIVGVNRKIPHETAKRVEALGRRFHAIQADLRDQQQLTSIVDEAVNKMGHLNILINNAGTIRRCDAIDFSEKDWDEVMDLNLKSLFFLSQAVARQFIAQGSGGKIINIASQAASIAIDNHVAYTSAKAGLLGMTKVMAKEFAPHRINVNTLSPTVVLTPMGEKAWRGEKGEEMKKLIPLGRFAYTDEIAAAVLFFASNGSDMITGADLMIDGGFTIW